jgi:hypothetical protein
MLESSSEVRQVLFSRLVHMNTLTKNVIEEMSDPNQ